MRAWGCGCCNFIPTRNGDLPFVNEFFFLPIFFIYFIFYRHLRPWQSKKNLIEMTKSKCHYVTMKQWRCYVFRRTITYLDFFLPSHYGFNSLKCPIVLEIDTGVVETFLAFAESMWSYFTSMKVSLLVIKQIYKNVGYDIYSNCWILPFQEDSLVRKIPWIMRCG